MNTPLSCFRVPSYKNLQPELRFQAVSCAADTRLVAWKPRFLSYVCQTHALGFKAGSSGCGDVRRRGAQARKCLPTGPLTHTAMVCPAVAVYCHPPSRTAMATVQQATAGKGTLKTSSLLYCDNCTLIGTGLEMTRPAYRLHIVSHEIWPKFPIESLFCILIWYCR